MSMITDQSSELVQLYARTSIMKQFGASPYGGNLSKWPSKMVDAFVILQDEQAKVDSQLIARERPPRPPAQRQKR